MIKHIFFDLDHTIWDFDKNAQETLNELYIAHELDELGCGTVEEFINRYTENNHELWRQYHLGNITKETLRSERFNKTFLQLGIDPEKVPNQFEDDYVRITPTKTNLFSGTEKVLNYLQQKYTLHIISNGFKESTLMKMSVCNLNPYFENVIISEDVGANKPDQRIFEFALEKANASKEESIMIGDSLEADVRGALDFGIKAIYFNPLKAEKPEDIEWEIHQLEELLQHF
jgi:putative hydrolase of the HAD superfamily